MNKILSYIRNPKKFILYLFRHGFFNFLDDETYLKWKFKLLMGYNLNLDDPKTFNEKLQWLKLYDRKDIYTQMVDKYAAKEYIQERIGKKYVIPTLGLYNCFDDIDFNKLPNKFVIKTTHDSGGVVLCHNKNELDKHMVKKIINKSLKHNFYNGGKEWPYKNVKRRIIVEEMLENKDGSDLIEYNFFCCNGEPKFILICHGDKRKTRYNDYYDLDFNKLDFRCKYAVSNKVEERPSNFAEMIEISRKLSKNIPQLRVDLYLCNGNIYVGELTFYHWSGFCPFEPKEWDLKLGEYIDLNIKKNKK